MDLVVEKSGNVAMITVPVEEIDASNANDLKRDAAPILETYNELVFDLSHVRFIDSSGLGALLSCLRKVNAKGGDIKLCGMSKHVRSVFELVRMHRIFEIFETREAAAQAFAQSETKQQLQPQPGQQQQQQQQLQQQQEEPRAL